jgi:hypothetical protein
MNTALKFPVVMSNGLMDNLGVENPPTHRTIGELGGSGAGNENISKSGLI